MAVAILNIYLLLLFLLVRFKVVPFNTFEGFAVHRSGARDVRASGSDGLGCAAR